MALEILGRGKQRGLINAKGLYEFTKGDFENNFAFISLIEDYLNSRTSYEDTEQILFNNLIIEIKTNGISDWTKIGAFLGNENIFKVFHYLQDEMSDDDYWSVLGKCYVMSSFSQSTYDFIKTFFQSNRPGKIQMMTEEERLEFDALPNVIEIFRGCSIHEIKSGNLRFSWTTKKSVAQFFAKRSKMISGTKNSVVSRILKKKRFLLISLDEMNVRLFIFKAFSSKNVLLD